MAAYRRHGIAWFPSSRGLADLTLMRPGGV